MSTRRILLIGLVLAAALLFLVASRAAASECPPINTCPDLTVTGLTCSHDGTHYWASFTVKNLEQYMGSDACQGQFTVWNPQDDDCGADSWFSFFDIPALDGGGSASLSASLDAATGCDHYKCCGILADVDDNVDEDSEQNNGRNSNLIYGYLLRGQMAAVGAQVYDPYATAELPVENAVLDIPVGWSVQVNPTTTTIPAAGTADVELTYFAPMAVAPLPEEIRVVTNSTDPEHPLVQDNVFILREDIGACCFLDGSCQMLPESDCAAEWGVWLGAAIFCAPGACPAPLGACCLLDGSCVISSAETCQPPMLWFAGVACSPSPCPPIAVEPSTWGRLKGDFR